MAASEMNRTASYQTPQIGECIAISNNAHLAKIIQDSQGVVIDFWSQTCPPCIRFKPIFEGAARGNKNKHIIFCTVDCDNVRDAATAHNVRSIPQINFFFNGKEHAKFTGANEPQFRKHLQEIHELTMSKAGSHMSMEYKQFKPMNRLPISFNSVS